VILVTAANGNQGKLLVPKLVVADFVGDPNVLTWLLGRVPTTFEEWVHAHYAAFSEGSG
jgi:hypothetical protein